MTEKNCKLCIHYSGLWNDPSCSHAPYCRKCIHYHTDLVDNFTLSIESGNEREAYEYLRKKFET